MKEAEKVGERSARTEPRFMSAKMSARTAFSMKAQRQEIDRAQLHVGRRNGLEGKGTNRAGEVALETKPGEPESGRKNEWPKRK